MIRIYSILAILLFSLLRLAAEQQAPGYLPTVQKLEKGFDPPEKCGSSWSEKVRWEMRKDDESLRNCSPDIVRVSFNKDSG